MHSVYSHLVMIGLDVILLQHSPLVLLLYEIKLLLRVELEVVFGQVMVQLVLLYGVLNLLRMLLIHIKHKVVDYSMQIHHTTLRTLF